MKTRSLLLAALLGVVACKPAATPAPMPLVMPPATITAQPPPPPDAAPVTEGDITQLSLNGALVLVKRVPGAELAAIHLYVRGGVRNWTAANAGVEQLALETATSGGTARLDKEAFTRKLAALGSNVGSSSGSEYGEVRAKTLVTKFDETFGLLFDAFLEPALPSAEIELQRQQMLSSLRHEEEDPDARLALMVHKGIFKGHPYENRPVGTPESVTKLGAEQLKAHLAELRQTSRLLLVVAGDVDPAHVAALARARLGSLPRGSYRGMPVPRVAFDKSSVEQVSAPLPTNYIRGSFVTPGWHDPDFIVSMVAMEHLGFRMFEEVRTKRNLSYAAAAGVRWATGIPLGSLYTTAVDPDTTIKVMFDEVKKLKSTPLTDKELAAAKSTFLTSHLVSSESTDGQADWLARAQIYGGDWRFERSLLEKVKAVDAKQVQAFAGKHITHLQFEILGKGTIDKALFGSL